MAATATGKTRWFPLLKYCVLSRNVERYHLAIAWSSISQGLPLASMKIMAGLTGAKTPAGENHHPIRQGQSAPGLVMQRCTPQEQCSASKGKAKGLKGLICPISIFALFSSRRFSDKMMS